MITFLFSFIYIKLIHNRCYLSAFHKKSFSIIHTYISIKLLFDAKNCFIAAEVSILLDSFF